MAAASGTFAAIANHDWANDSEFQTGLRTILQSSATNDRASIEHLTRRAQCYFFARKHGISVDFEAYGSWLANRPASSTLEAQSRSAETQSQTLDSEVNGSNGINSTDTDATAQPSQQVQNIHIEPDSTAPSSTSSTSTPFTDPYGDAPTPVSFEEICRMISQGVPVPGIKEIPDTVLEGQTSTSSAPTRRKPWQVAATSDTARPAARAGGIPAWQAGAT